MAFLTNLALAVTRAIDPKRLYDWMIAVSNAASSMPAFLGIGPFETVARASGARMLDLSAGDCASLVDGAEVWVDSFGGGPWFWRATIPSGFICDNQTTCRPTAWAAVVPAPDGAFERGTAGSRLAQRQTAWQIDSTATDNEGAGTLADPLQSDIEIPRRWGPPPTELFDTTTVTYAQAPTATQTDIAVLLPTGALFKIKGTPATLTTGVVITAVQAQVRTAGSEVRHAITGAGLGAAQVGHLAIIRQSATPSHVDAYARIVKDEGSGKVIVTPFGTYTADFAPITQITPSIGDVVDVITPMNLPVAKISVGVATNRVYGDFPPTFVNYFQVEDCRIDGGDDGGGVLLSTNVEGFAARTLLRNITIAGDSVPSGYVFYLAGGGIDGVVFVNSAFQISQAGIVEATVFLQPNAVCVVDSDTYFENATYSAQFQGYTLSFGGSFFNQDTSNSTILIGPSTTMVQAGGVPDWGTNNSGHGIKIQTNGTYTYVTKPTVNGTLGAGREALIGGTDKQYGAVPFTEAANTAKLVVTA